VPLRLGRRPESLILHQLMDGAARPRSRTMRSLPSMGSGSRILGPVALLALVALLGSARAAGSSIAELPSLDWVTIPSAAARRAPLSATSASATEAQINSCQMNAPLQCGFVHLGMETIVFLQGVLEFDWFTGLCSKQCLNFLANNPDCQASGEVQKTMVDICGSYKCANDVKQACGKTKPGDLVEHDVACGDDCHNAVFSKVCARSEEYLPGFSLYKNSMGPNGTDCMQYGCREKLLRGCGDFDSAQNQLPGTSLCHPECWAAALSPECMDGDVVTKDNSGKVLGKWRDSAKDLDVWGPDAKRCLANAPPLVGFGPGASSGGGSGGDTNEETPRGGTGGTGSNTGNPVGGQSPPGSATPPGSGAEGGSTTGDGSTAGGSGDDQGASGAPPASGAGSGSTGSGSPAGSGGEGGSGSGSGLSPSPGSGSGSPPGGGGDDGTSGGGVAGGDNGSVSGGGPDGGSGGGSDGDNTNDNTTSVGTAGGEGTTDGNLTTVEAGGGSGSGGDGGQDTVPVEERSVGGVGVRDIADDNQPVPEDDPNGSKNVAAIVGGTLAGATVVAGGAYAYRRRKKPGQDGAQAEAAEAAAPADAEAAPDQV